MREIQSVRERLVDDAATLRLAGHLRVVLFLEEALRCLMRVCIQLEPLAVEVETGRVHVEVRHCFAEFFTLR